MCSEMSRDFIKLMKNYYLDIKGLSHRTKAKAIMGKHRRKNDKENFLVRILFRSTWMGTLQEGISVRSPTVRTS